MQDTARYSRTMKSASIARTSNATQLSALLILLASMSMLVSSPVHAAKGDKWLGYQLGGSIPVGDFGAAVGSGFQGAIMGAYSPAAQTELDVDVAYYDWARRASPDPIPGWLIGYNTRDRYKAGMAHVHVTRFSPSLRNMSLYGKGGFGATLVYTSLHHPSGQFYDPTTEYGFDVDVGGGVSFEVAPGHRVGLGALYHILQASGATVNFVSLGMNVMWAIGRR